MQAKQSPLIEALRLQPHVEGGWFRETWRTALNIPQAALGPGYEGDRSAATAVYFLLQPGEVSNWHVVASDELWIWQSGSPLKLTLGGSGARPDAPGDCQEITLGMDVPVGQQPQALVPAAVWQTATPLGDEPVLCTCIVAPGFDFRDFRLQAAE